MISEKTDLSGSCVLESGRAIIGHREGGAAVKMTPTNVPFASIDVLSSRDRCSIESRFGLFFGSIGHLLRLDKPPVANPGSMPGVFVVCHFFVTG